MSNSTPGREPSVDTERLPLPVRKLVVTTIVAMIVVVVAMNIVRFQMIHGNELGVKESWQKGVEDNVYPPGMHILFPAWSQQIYAYDASSQVFVMNNKSSRVEKTATGREKDAYLVQSQEGQDMWISLNLRWRIDPAKLVSLHKTVRRDLEEKLIRPVVMRVVKDEATKLKAIESYSGEGLVKLQSNIQTILSGAGEGAELIARGVIVENFVIEHIELDPLYIAEIKGKQVATQKALRSVEEQKAAEAAALVAKATAQSDLNRAVVEAERDKQVRILKAKADNESAIIAANAEQQKRVLEAEGKRDADIAIAKGVLAMGEAEATAIKLRLQAYAVPGSDTFARVEVAKQVAIAFQNVHGYLPNVNSINLLGSNFEELVTKLASPKPAPTPAPRP